MSHPPVAVVVLAAGEGKRMRSRLPKVLHPLAGKPMLERVVATASAISPERIVVVYGHGGELVRSTLSHLDVRWVEQREQLGTGHAVEQAVPHIPDGDTVLVLYGDVPLISAETLREVSATVDSTTIGLVTVEVDDPSGYGRILRDERTRVTGVVEDKDAAPAQRNISEINTGILALPAIKLRTWLSSLDAANVQGEYYLTDVIGLACRDGMEVRTVAPRVLEEVLGVNDRAQLARLERYHQHNEATRLMQAGVTLRDPARLDIRGELSVGLDIVIDVNVVLEGHVVLGDEVRIGPNTIICNSEIGPGSEILANCVIEGAIVGSGCRVGPYSRLRPGTQLHDRVHVGNFVEMKQSRIGSGSKVNHLSYVGDAEVGREVNVGAGTITCNYDGANKHPTIIGDNAFVGSGTMLVAPVTVASGSTIGAGSTITEDTPANELTLARTRQRTIPGWRRPVKK